MKHASKWILSTALALALLGGCAAPQAPAASQSAQSAQGSAPQENGYDPVTISNYNYAGEAVTYTYTQPPQRVVCVYQGCIETMIALGLEDHVIASYGLDNEVKEQWQEGFAQMHYDESVFAPDKETMTLLEPDFIFTWHSAFSEKKLGDVDGWNQKGVGTYMSQNSGAAEERTVEHEYEDILNIGKIFHVEDRAQALVDEMSKAVEETLAAAAGREAVTVAVLEPLNGVLSNYHANTLAGDMVQKLGGTLVKPQGNEMGKEELVALDPEVIFVVYMAYSGDSPEEVMAAQLSAIEDDPALASLSAVKEGRIYPIMLGDMYASGPRTLDGIRAFAAGLYPET